MAQYNDFGEMMNSFGNTIQKGWIRFGLMIGAFFNSCKFLIGNIFYIVLKVLFLIIFVPICIAFIMLHFGCFIIFCIAGWLPLVAIIPTILLELSALLLKLFTILIMIPEFCFKKTRNIMDEKVAQVEGLERIFEQQSYNRNNSRDYYNDDY